MAIAKKGNGSSIWSELWTTNLYKRNQGRLVRQLTAVALLLILYFGAWTLSQGPLTEIRFTEPVIGENGQPVINEDGTPLVADRVGMNEAVRLGIPFLIAAVGTWVVYRVVNYPRFADFLISVEAEMDKVSWPSWAELWRSAAVVIVTMVCLGLVLLGFDVFWHAFFRFIGFLRV